MSQPNIREIIKTELVKCAKEPQYFMKKYCVVQHPMRGKVPFHLYPYQEKCLDVFEQDDKLFNVPKDFKIAPVEDLDDVNELLKTMVKRV